MTFNFTLTPIISIILTPIIFDPNYFGKAVYAGLSDRFPRDAVDHDYQDMGVRISVGVPEPGSLALMSLGVLGFGALRRRRAA